MITSIHPSRSGVILAVLSAVLLLSPAASHMEKTKPKGQSSSRSSFRVARRGHEDESIRHRYVQVAPPGPPPPPGGVDCTTGVPVALQSLALPQKQTLPPAPNKGSDSDSGSKGQRRLQMGPGPKGLGPGCSEPPTPSPIKKGSSAQAQGGSLAMAGPDVTPSPTHWNYINNQPTLAPWTHRPTASPTTTEFFKYGTQPPSVKPVSPTISPTQWIFNGNQPTIAPVTPTSAPVNPTIAPVAPTASPTLFGSYQDFGSPGPYSMPTVTPAVTNTPGRTRKPRHTHRPSAGPTVSPSTRD